MNQDPSIVAKEIIDKYWDKIEDIQYGDWIEGRKECAKECAIIHVQGIIDEWDKIGGYNVEAEDDNGIACSPSERQKHWKDILAEIIKL